MLKSKLQEWVVDDETIRQIAEQLKEAGINEDLACHAIERKIEEHQPLLNILKHIPASSINSSLNQESNIGHNIISSGCGNVSVGGININKDII